MNGYALVLMLEHCRALAEDEYASAHELARLATILSTAAGATAPTGSAADDVRRVREASGGAGAGRDALAELASSLIGYLAGTDWPTDDAWRLALLLEPVYGLRR